MLAYILAYMRTCKHICIYAYMHVCGGCRVDWTGKPPSLPPPTLPPFPVRPAPRASARATRAMKNFLVQRIAMKNFLVERLCPHTGFARVGGHKCSTRKLFMARSARPRVVKSDWKTNRSHSLGCRDADLWDPPRPTDFACNSHTSNEFTRHTSK